MAQVPLRVALAHFFESFIVYWPQVAEVLESYTRGYNIDVFFAVIKETLDTVDTVILDEVSDLSFRHEFLDRWRLARRGGAGAIGNAAAARDVDSSELHLIPTPDLQAPRQSRRCVREAESHPRAILAESIRVSIS